MSQSVLRDLIEDPDFIAATKLGPDQLAIYSQTEDGAGYKAVPCTGTLRQAQEVSTGMVFARKASGEIIGLSIWKVDVHATTLADDASVIMFTSPAMRGWEVNGRAARIATGLQAALDRKSGIIPRFFRDQPLSWHPALLKKMPGLAA